MDIDRNVNETFKPPLEVESRVKSPTRMRYEAEVQFLKNQHGDLDQIRQKLGLSRRKICQLLLVDPSAWTRWTAPGGEAPPHIYRALDWYLSIMEKDPEYRRMAHRLGEWIQRDKDHEGRILSLESKVSVAHSQDSRTEMRQIWWLVATFAAGLLGGGIFVWMTLLHPALVK